jgi:hypothetical protein
MVSEEYALNPDARTPFKLSSLPHNVAEVPCGVPGQVTGERKEMRSVNRARTNRKKLIALMSLCVCVCVCAEGPVLPNIEINHTQRSYLDPYEGRCMGGVEVLKIYRNALFVYKTGEMKWRGRQFIYLTKTHRSELPILLEKDC